MKMKKITVLGLAALMALTPLTAQAQTPEEQELDRRYLAITSKLQEVKTGLTNIESELKKQDEERAERIQKLRSDRSYFLSVGSGGVPKDSMFYLTNPTGLSAYELDLALANTGLAGLGADFKKAEETYHVNALFLIGIANLESAYGNSYLARTKNNLFGFRAYNRSPIKSAATYATKGESIMDVAEFLSRNYLSENGKFFNGVSAQGVNVKYCTSSSWAGKVENQMSRTANKILNIVGNY